MRFREAKSPFIEVVAGGNSQFEKDLIFNFAQQSLALGGEFAKPIHRTSGPCLGVESAAIVEGCGRLEAGEVVIRRVNCVSAKSAFDVVAPSSRSGAARSYMARSSAYQS